MNERQHNLSQLPPTGAELDLPGLVELASALCATLPKPSDGRISGQIDVRLVRYYQSAGLLESPLRYEGRSAVYGRQHVVDLVCVRALQARGLGLGQIQAAMAAMPGAERAEAAADALRRVTPMSTTTESMTTEPAPTLQAGLRCTIAPGVEVWIDPERVPAAAALVEALRAAAAAHVEKSR